MQEEIECIPQSDIEIRAGHVPQPIHSDKPDEEYKFQIANLIPSAGQIELTDEQKAILYADANDDDIEIRPDGLIYLPWMEYATRLRKAFGMNWSMIPDGQPKFGVNKTSILWGFYLIVQGKLVGYAIGEQNYHANNPTMGWSDACEGAKSNALMRLCKGIGMTLELWKPSFIKAWIEGHAVRDGNKWKKKEVTDDDGGQSKGRVDAIEPESKGHQPSSPTPPSHPTATITLTDGKEVAVGKYDALKYFASIKAAIKKATLKYDGYYEALSAMKVNHANELSLQDIPTAYNLLVNYFRQITKAAK